jgi:hypothetical protein
VGVLARSGARQLAVPSPDHRLKELTKLVDFRLPLAQFAQFGRGNCTHTLAGYSATLPDAQHTRQFIDAESDA